MAGLDTFAKRHAERRRQFVERTIDGVAPISRTISELRMLSRSESTTQLERLDKLFHKLNGGAGIYELDEFCLLLSDAQLLCKQMLSSEHEDIGQNLTALELTVDKIRESLRQAQDSG